jgi:hypothetical protein
MSRDLTAAMIAAIQAGTIRPVIFYQGEFSSGTVYLWSGMNDISWNGQTWTGAGNMLGVSVAREVQGIEAVKFVVALNGESQSLLSLNLSAVRQGLPGTVWLGAISDPDAYLSLPGVTSNWASTPDSDAIDAACASGRIGGAIHLAAADWTPAAIQCVWSKFLTTGNQRSHRLFINTNGRPQLRISDTGATEITINATAAPTITNGDDLWLGYDFLGSDGSGNRVTKFYISTDGVTWTQLGATVTTAGTLNIFSGTAAVAIGAAAASGAGSMFVGDVYYADFRSGGIDGTIVAKFDAKKFASKNIATAQADTGETWTINKSGTSRALIVRVPEALIADPFIMFKGKMDVPDIVDDGERCTLAVSYESRLIDLERARIKRYTQESQQIDYASDLGFQFVPGLQDAQVSWGPNGGTHTLALRR